MLLYLGKILLFVGWTKFQSKKWGTRLVLFFLSILILILVLVLILIAVLFAVFIFAVAFS